MIRRTPSLLSLVTALDQSVTRLDSFGVRYTRRQLYYEVCRTLRPFSCLVDRWSYSVTGGIAGLMALSGRRPLWNGLVSAAVRVTFPQLVRHLPFTIHPPVSVALFDEALAVYQTRYGEPAGLLSDVPPMSSLTFGERESDLYDYGLAYAIICQDSSIAHMLRANYLHMEIPCAILAAKEATPLPDALVAMLMRAPSPRVLLLHDASPSGMRWVREAPAQLELPYGLRVRSLGLRPIHALRRHLFALHQPVDLGEIPVTLLPIERLWMGAGLYTEIAALPPVSLLRALRAVTRVRPKRASWWSRVRQWRISGYMSWVS